ncbi:MAG: SMC-Scp complex subunit ScpB [Candidatus Omnitrophota bacterium]|jgi:segregation and condensation protein B
MENQETSGLDKKNIKSIIESLLFVNERPIEITEICEIISIDKKIIEDSLEELTKECAERSSGVSIIKVAGGYQMCTSAGNELWVKKMYRERGKQKLSVAALETLAIISYKQPITRTEIEAIRGVNIDAVTKHLTDLGLIKIEGRKEVPGRPFLYVTTRKFLEYFGLNSLKDLPKIEDFMVLAKKDNLVDASVVAEENMPAQNDNNELPQENSGTHNQEAEVVNVNEENKASMDNQ